MARSLKKGPFVDEHLLEKALALSDDPNKGNKVIKRGLEGPLLFRN